MTKPPSNDHDLDSLKIDLLDKMMCAVYIRYKLTSTSLSKNLKSEAAGLLFHNFGRKKQEKPYYFAD